MKEGPEGPFCSRSRCRAEPGSVLEQRAQHPGGLLVHVQALGQQVGRGLVGGLVDQRVERATRAGHGFVTGHQDADHFLGLGRLGGRVRQGAELGVVGERALGLETQRADALGDWVHRVPQLGVLVHEHHVQRVEHRPRHVPVEVVRGQVEGEGGGQQAIEALGDGGAMIGRDADVDRLPLGGGLGSRLGRSFGCRFCGRVLVGLCPGQSPELATKGRNDAFTLTRPCDALHGACAKPTPTPPSRPCMESIAHSIGVSLATLSINHLVPCRPKFTCTRAWLKLMHSRRRARVMATYIRRRSSSRPSVSDIEFSCGNRPSSRPVRNTCTNSRPLAAWMVMSCTASWPAWAWLSPASSEACVKKASSGEMISPVSASGSVSPCATAAGSPCAIVPADSSTGRATASLPKPSWVTKASAALTNSSRFSSRSWPSFSLR